MNRRVAKLLKVAALLAVILLLELAIAPRFPSGSGNSMAPTLRDGQRCIYIRPWPWRGIRKGDIVLFDDPLSESLAVKRVEWIDPELEKIWVQSDADVAIGTIDSDQFGWLDRGAVRGVLVARLPACFDGEKTEEPSRERKYSMEERLEAISARLIYNAGRERAIRDDLEGNQVVTNVPLPLEKPIFLSGGERAEVSIFAENPFRTLVLWEFSAEYSEVEVLLPSGGVLSSPSVAGEDGTVTLELPEVVESCRLVITGLQDMPGGLTSLLAITVR